MRFPLSLTRAMTAYLLRQRVAGRKHFPIVLMLEPLHACNLRCSGCGRIREYADTVTQHMTVDECLESLDQCQAPIVSVCGGEPLLYPHLRELLEQILARRKHMYLCTNGLLLAKRLDELPRDHRLFINVHLDGMEDTHDAITGRPGSFGAAVEGIKAAKGQGRTVYTNTTIYRQTDMCEVAVLLEYLTQLGVDGFMVSPAYEYSSVQNELEASDEAIFLTRDEIVAQFRKARPFLERFRLTATPVYLDFLCGERTLPCAAWANPTRNIRGWKAPCYLMTDGHYATYEEMVRATQWDRLGPGGDPRCEHCMVHCGFEPAAVMASMSVRDLVKMALWQIS